MMLEDDGHVPATGGAILLSASFDAPNNTFIRNYTPEVGPKCAQSYNFTVYGTVESIAPDGTIYGNVLRRGGYYRGPMYLVSTTAVAIQAKVAGLVTDINVTLSTRLPLTDGVRGCRASLAPSGIQIRSQSGQIIGTSTHVIAPGDTVRFEDTGLNTVGSIKVFANGVLVAQNTGVLGLIAPVGMYVSCIPCDDCYIDDLLVTEL